MKLLSSESDSKNSFSRSRSIGSDPGIMEIIWIVMKNLAQLEMIRIRNEQDYKWALGMYAQMLL